MLRLVKDEDTSLLITRLLGSRYSCLATPFCLKITKISL